MKIKNLLPLAFALMLCTPAFAAPAEGSASAEGLFSVEVPAYINITRTSPDAKLTTTVTSIGADYSSLTFAGSMEADFHVATNYDGAKVYLNAKDAGLAYETLFADNSAENIRIVFTNNAFNAEMSQEIIDRAGAYNKDSKNAFAINVTNNHAAAADTSNSLVSAIKEKTYDSATHKTTYTLANGQYSFNYILDSTVNNNSFTALDQNGTYKATLYMTHTGV